MSSEKMRWCVWLISPTKMHFSLCLTSSELKLYRKTHFFHDGSKTVFLKICNNHVLNFRATSKPSYGHAVSAQNHLTVQNYHAIIILFSCLYMCILCCICCWFAFGGGIWDCIWGNEAWCRFRWRHVCLGLVLISIHVQLLGHINHTVLFCVSL